MAGVTFGETPCAISWLSGTTASLNSWMFWFGRARSNWRTAPYEFGTIFRDKLKGSAQREQPPAPETQHGPTQLA